MLAEGLAVALKARNDDLALRTFFALVEKLDRAGLALCLLDGALQGVASREVPSLRSSVYNFQDG